MCSRPSTSLPLLMRCSVVASVFSSTAIFISLTNCRHWLILAHALEITAAARAAELAQQQLRAEQRNELGRRRPAEWTADGLGLTHRSAELEHDTRGRARVRHTPASFSYARRSSGRYCRVAGRLCTPRRPRPEWPRRSASNRPTASPTPIDLQVTSPPRRGPIAPPRPHHR